PPGGAVDQLLLAPFPGMRRQILGEELAELVAEGIELLGHPGRSVLHAALAVRWRGRRRQPPPSLCSSVLVRGTDAGVPPAGVDFDACDGLDSRSHSIASPDAHA